MLLGPRPPLHRPRLAALAALVALATTPLIAAAGGPVYVGSHPVRWTTARLAPTALAAPAITVARDPETGLLGLPSAAEAQRLAASASLTRPRPPLVVQTLPDGTLKVDGGDAFLWDLVVVKDADGRLRAVCSDDPHARDRALAGATAPAPAPLPEE